MKVVSFFGMILALVTGFVGNARAWGPIGHATTAEIAERALTPRARALVFKVMGVEPLSVSANFPDEVRSDARFAKFADDHFAIIPTGGAYGDISHPAHDMNSMLILAMKKLSERRTSREEKLIYMRYLIHIVGDTHQPLHVSSPGSIGGNFCTVKYTDPANGLAKTDNIHHFFDETLIEFERRNYIKAHPSKGLNQWFGYFEYADMVLADPMAADIRAEIEHAGPIKDADFATWMTDTGKLGESAYPPAVEKTPGHRPYCKYLDPVTGKISNPDFDEKTVPTMDEAYVTKWLPTIRAQIIRGGLRLAKVLDRTAEMAHIKPMKRDEQSKVIQSILDH